MNYTDDPITGEVVLFTARSIIVDMDRLKQRIQDATDYAEKICHSEPAYDAVMDPVVYMKKDLEAIRQHLKFTLDNPWKAIWRYRRKAAWREIQDAQKLRRDAYQRKVAQVVAEVREKHPNDPVAVVRAELRLTRDSLYRAIAYWDDIANMMRYDLPV